MFGNTECNFSYHERTGKNPEDGREINDASVTPSSLVVTATHSLTQHPDEQDDRHHNANHLQDECNDGNSSARYQPCCSNTHIHRHKGHFPHKYVVIGCQYTASELTFNERSIEQIIRTVLHVLHMTVVHNDMHIQVNSSHR